MSPRPEPKPQVMPLDRAILWNPPAAPGTTNPGRPSSRSPYPIFFQQEAVIALQEHLKGSPTQAIFGFLIGDVYRDPETGVLYIVIDKTLKLSQAIYGDKTEVVVSRLWDRMQEQLMKASAHLLGWYHSHPGQGGLLTAHDVETHDKFFTDPWHVAVLVAAEAGGVTGRFFRSNKTADWHKVPLPFYELLQPDSIKPDGKKRSFITWRNYKPYGPTLEGPKPKAPELPAPPPLPPKAEEPEAAEAEASADDIAVIKSSADDEPAPAKGATRPAAPVFVPDRAPVPRPPPPPPARPAPSPPPRASDDLPWEVAPSEVAPPPLPMPPPRVAPPPFPAAPRRAPSRSFRLLDQEPAKKPVPKRRRRRGPWLRRLATLLVLAGVGAGGYWYLVVKNPALLPGLVDRAKELVSRFTAKGPPPAAPPRPRPVAVPATQPAAPPPPPPPAASPFARFDRLSDSLSGAVRNFQDRARLFASGQMDCGGLARGLVAVDNLWITYNNERKGRLASLDPQRAARDQGLWASVDSVSRHFDNSGCPRP
jgi:proteasome lid subunit RPN8/RPN11